MIFQCFFLRVYIHIEILFYYHVIHYYFILYAPYHMKLPKYYVCHERCTPYIFTYQKL